MLTLALTLSSILAISAPPAAVLAWICFIVAAILAGIAKNWWGLLISLGLSLMVWPW